MEPRLTGLDLEFISEHHPTVEGVTRVEAALHIPRKTFRAHAEAGTSPARSTRSRRSSNASSGTTTEAPRAVHKAGRLAHGRRRGCRSDDDDDG